jgi:flagellar motor protein MotB
MSGFYKLGIVLLFLVCKELPAQNQDSLQASNTKRIEDLKARLNRLSRNETDCDGKVEQLNNIISRQRDSIKALQVLIRMDQDLTRKFHGYMHLNPCSCNRIYYDAGKSSTDYSKYPELDSVATLLKTDPALRIKLIGHCDKVGQEKINLPLSMHRAENVKAYFMNHFKIDGARIFIEGHGSREHIKEITDPEMFYLDRRVEVFVEK